MARRIDLNLIHVFQAIMLERNVTRAADRLNLGQSTISMALAKLRSMVGDPLFVRAPHGVAPTPLALSLADDLRAGMDHIEAAIARATVFEPSRSETVFTLIAPDDVRALFLPELMSRLHIEAPGVRLKILPPAPRQIGEALEVGMADFGIGFMRVMPGSLRAKRMFSDRFVWTSAGAATASLADTLTIDDLNACKYVDVGPVGLGLFADMIDANFRRRKMTRDVALRETSFLILPHVLASGRLLAAVPYRTARQIASRDPSLRLHEAPVSMPSVSTHLYWHERSHTLKSHSWIRSLVHRAAQEIASKY